MSKCHRFIECDVAASPYEPTVKDKGCGGWWIVNVEIAFYMKTREQFGCEAIASETVPIPMCLHVLRGQVPIT